MTKKELFELLSGYPDNSLINFQSEDFFCNFGISKIYFDNVTNMPELCQDKPLGPVICISLRKWTKLNK